MTDADNPYLLVSVQKELAETKEIVLDLTD